MTAIFWCQITEMKQRFNWRSWWNDFTLSFLQRTVQDMYYICRAPHCLGFRNLTHACIFTKLQFAQYLLEKPMAILSIVISFTQADYYGSRRAWQSHTRGRGRLGKHQDRHIFIMQDLDIQSAFMRNSHVAVDGVVEVVTIRRQMKVCTTSSHASILIPFSRV